MHQSDLYVDDYLHKRPPSTRTSDEPPPKKVKWTNRQRVLMFACRGISHSHRHLMMDLRKMMPHSRPDNKMERRKSFEAIKELCEMKNCNKAVLFEGRQVRDLYVWLGEVPNGPSAKFLVENIYTTAELKLTGNCLQGSRPLLSFDKTFDKQPHYRVLKELLIQIFGTPKGHPKSQPYIDHVFTFSIMDNRVWFRNYQILAEDGALAEIGPRFVLNPIKIFAGSFGGDTLWENPKYISPAKTVLLQALCVVVWGQVPQQGYQQLPYAPQQAAQPLYPQQQANQAQQAAQPFYPQQQATQAQQAAQPLYPQQQANQAQQAAQPFYPQQQATQAQQAAQPFYPQQQGQAAAPGTAPGQTPAGMYTQPAYGASPSTVAGSAPSGQFGHSPRTLQLEPQGSVTTPDGSHSGTQLFRGEDTNSYVVDWSYPRTRMVPYSIVLRKYGAQQPPEYVAMYRLSGPAGSASHYASSDPFELIPGDRSDQYVYRTV